MKKTSMTMALALTGFAALAHADEAQLPESYLDLSVGHDQVRSYAYGADSDRATGTREEVGARGVFGSGFLLEGSFTNTEVGTGGIDLQEKRSMVGMGVGGAVGTRSTWYVEGFGENVQFIQSTDRGCGFNTCPSTHYNGGGLKSGIEVPMSDFFATVGVSIADLAAPRHIDNQLQGVADVNLGYHVTRHLIAAVGVEGEAFMDDHHNEGLAHVSYHGTLGYHF